MVRSRRTHLALVTLAFAVSAAPVHAQSEFERELKLLLDLSAQRQFSEAVQHGLRAMELDPKSWMAPFQVSRAQGPLNQYAAADASITKAIAAYEAGAAPQELRYHVVLYAQRAGFRKWLGELTAGLADIDKALQLAPGNGVALDMRGQFQMLVGRKDEAVATLAEALANHRPEDERTLRKFNIMFNWAEALRLAGKDQEALDGFDRAMQLPDPERHQALAGKARVLTLTKDPALRDHAKARALLDEVAAQGGPLRLRVANADAILSYYEENYERALALFRLSEHAFDDTEGVYYHGLACLKTGDTAGAVRFLAQAASLGDAWQKLVEAEPLVQPVRAEVAARVKDLSGKSSVQDRVRTRGQQEIAVEDLAQINSFVRGFKLDLAVRDLEKYGTQTGAESVKAEVAARVARVRLYQKLLERLIAAINTGALKGKAVELSGLGKLTLSSADPAGITVALEGGKGSSKAAWAGLSFADRYALLERIAPSPAEWWSLSWLAEDADAPKLAERAMVEAWKKDPARRDEIGRRLARIRGTSVPPGGYALHEGRFVGADEKAQLDKGLVRFRGEWVTAEDKHHLERNHTKIDGKWVPLTEDQLKARGYVQHEGKWVTSQELSALRGEWASAWTHETAHYRIKCNVSEKFAQKLGVALEDAYAAYRQFFGKDPQGTGPQLVLAMRDFEDYRQYCQQNDMMNMVNATGFAMAHKRTVIGYDKLKDLNSLLGTMLHEGAHLYFGLAYPTDTPSWLAEGMATYFEGFKADQDGHVTFDHCARSRLQQLQMAIGGKQTIPLDQFLASNALVLINTDSNKALVFYAEAWGLFYFCHHTIDARFKDAFAKYFDGVKRGAQPELKKLLGADYAEFEQEFLKFIRSM